MRKPLSEYETTLTARKHRAHPAPDPDAAMEGVRGGRVRRIVFEADQAEPEPQPEPEPEPEARETLRYQEVHERRYMPRHQADIRDIERDVDRIIGRASSPPPARTIRRERTIYETPGGEVSEEIRETREGRTRALYVSRREGPVTKERRFSGADVDRILAERPPSREVIRETYRETREVTAKEHERPKGRTTAKKRRRTRRKERSKATAKKPEPQMEQPVPAAPAYEPQCGAVTRGGKQCRNSAKHGSKYCGAHQGYKPLSMQQIMARQDTEPTVGSAADTLPASGTRSTTKGYQAQCAALTADGGQCKNSSRAGSKYCGSHRNYRPQSIESKMDTKPRVKKAEDTKPAIKKAKRASTRRRAASRAKATASKAGAKKAAKKGTGKKAAAKRSAGQATKSSTAKRSGGKKATAKRSGGKKASKRGAKAATRRSAASRAKAGTGARKGARKASKSTRTKKAGRARKAPKRTSKRARKT